MSTNYYWIIEEPAPPDVRLPSGEYVVASTPTIDTYDVHIGKRYGTPDGCRFIWAIQPKVMLARFELMEKRYNNEDEIVIIDEYGRKLSWADFEVVLYDCSAWELTNIGSRFC